MPAMYPLDMKKELETMHAGIGYLKSIGFSWDVLDELLGVPSGAVKTWILRGADGFHPLLVKGWRKPQFFLMLFLCSFLGVWDGMQREALTKIADDTSWERQDEYWEVFCKDILSLGGVSSYRGDDWSKELTVIPNNLIGINGLKPSRIAQILADYFPGYGVSTELDFDNICERYSNFQEAKRLRKGLP